jgi:hypothetical protein
MREAWLKLVYDGPMRAVGEHFVEFRLHSGREEGWLVESNAVRSGYLLVEVWGEGDTWADIAVPSVLDGEDQFRVFREDLGTHPEAE